MLLSTILPFGNHCLMCVECYVQKSNMHCRNYVQELKTITKSNGVKKADEISYKMTRLLML